MYATRSALHTCCPQVMSYWNGNVDLTQINAMMAIAVFNEDPTLFWSAVTRWHNRTLSYVYLTSAGRVPPILGDGGNVQVFWSNPQRWVNGLTQETCRDNGHHAQYALGSAVQAAEIAWHQGYDLYITEIERYVDAFELLARQFLEGSMLGICSGTPVSDRYDSWEIAYNHFANRMGIPLPYTQKLIQSQIRPVVPSANWNLVYESITHTRYASW